MEYTKGEWKLDDVIGRVHAWQDDEAKPIADILGNPDNERVANAHLISAAPDLYEALTVINATINPLDDVAIVNKMVNALRKAEGK